MYTVNGKHPGVAYSSQTLKNGDSVVFHYIDDYSTEETRATWLRAEDISPAEYVRPTLAISSERAAAAR